MKYILLFLLLTIGTVYAIDYSNTDVPIKTTGTIEAGSITSTNVLTGKSLSLTGGDSGLWLKGDGTEGTLEVPYQIYSDTVTPDAGGTCTVTYAKGSLVKISVSTNITLTFDNTAYPTNGVNRVAVEILALTNSVAFATATITNATAPTVSTSSWTSLFFRKSGSDTLWTGRQ